MRFFKVSLPIALAFIMAVIAMTGQFVSHHYSDNFTKETVVWQRVIGGMTMFIGAYSLLRVHYNKIKRKQKGWGYSGLLYVFFIAMVVFGVLNFGIRKVDETQAMNEEQLVARGVTTRPDVAVTTGPDATTRPGALTTTSAEAATKPNTDEIALALTLDTGKPLTDDKGRPMFILVKRDQADSGTRALIDARKKTISGPGGKPLYVDIKTGKVTETGPTAYLGPLKPKTTEKEGMNWLYESVQRPAGATQYSLLGFFICSAAFRTFRAKTVEAGFLLVAAMIVMLGQVPISALIWDRIPWASGLLLDVPNMAVKRAILFGICVGSVGTALRVMFGIERSYMGGD